MQTASSRLIAACFSMSAFAVAIVSGLACDNAAGEILWRAFIAMLVCYPAGFTVGMICEGVIAAHIAAHQEANPAPDSANFDARAPSATTDGADPLMV